MTSVCVSFSYRSRYGGKLQSIFLAPALKWGEKYATLRKSAVGGGDVLYSMKKRVTAVLVLLVVLVSLCAVPVRASGLFFLSLNDTLPPQSTQTTPIQYNGWVYVPVSIFNNQVTGINFGIYYGFTDNNESLVFYDLSGKVLTFDLVNGTASATNGDPPVPDRVTWQNGMCYVPAYAICRYFGLTYSFYSTDYGPLVRIKNGNAEMSDARFLNYASSMMRGRYNSYYGISTQPTTPSTPTTPPKEETPEITTPTVPQVPEDEPRPVFSLALGLRATPEQSLTGALTALANAGATAVVFFPADTLVESRDQIRQAAGRGHQVGLIPVGETEEARLESVQKGSALLAQIIHRETWFVLSSDALLSQSGYLCWQPSLTPNRSSGATGIYEAILAHCQEKNGQRILLDTRTSSAILAGVLTQLAKDGDTFLRARETLF